MDEFWSNLLVQILVVALPPLVVALLAWLFAQIKMNWAKAKQAAPELCYALEEAASLAVKAAEQSKLAGFISDKKTEALKIAELYLASRGFKVDLRLIEASIERAVLEYFPHEDEPKTMGFDK
jgi:hypothetical protein